MENQNLEETQEEKKQRFEHRFKPFLAQLLAKKETQNNSNFLSEDRYSGIIADLVRIRDRGPTSQKLDPAQYKKELRLSSRFRLATLPNGTLRLRDSNGKDFMKNEEIFFNLWDCHKELMHGSREPMERRRVRDQSS